MAEGRRTGRVLATVSAGVVIGVVEVVLAISFAALVFGGYLEQFLPAGIGIYLVAASLTLAILAWRAGVRGVVGSVQDAAVAVLAIVADSAALDTFGGINRAFLTVVAATLVVTLADGARRSCCSGRSGWATSRGSSRIRSSAGSSPAPDGCSSRAVCGSRRASSCSWARSASSWTTSSSCAGSRRSRSVSILLVATRVVKRPLVIPVVLGLGLALFAIGMLVTGSSLQEAREGLWLLGPFHSTRLWQPWTIRAITGADWSAVLDQAAGIATAVFVAVMACLFNVGGVELLLHTDLDSNEELRDAGLVNVVSGLFGGIPGYHALSLTALAQQMAVDGRGRRPRGRPRPARDRRLRRRRRGVAPADDRGRRAGVRRAVVPGRVGRRRAPLAARWAST